MPLIEEFNRHGNFLFRYRSMLPLVAFLTALGIFIFNKIYSRPNLTGLSDLYILSCFAVSMVGFAIRVYTVGHTPDRTSGRNTKEQVADRLNTTGSYSLVRHPLYLGNFFMWLGLAMLSNSVWFVVVFILGFWLYYERIMFAEEMFLRTKFGDDYINWASKVPAFVPNLRNWMPPDTKFRIKKVLRKEKDGFVAVVLIVFIFNFIQEYGRVKAFDHFDIWFFLTISAIIVYAVLQFLKKKTQILKD